MITELSHYLESIRCNSKLEQPDEKEIICEIEAHLEDKLQELTESGVPKEDAVKTCLAQMGSPKLIARRLYETYSQGSWRQVLLASMPHLLFGLLFVLNWWQYVGWLSVVLVLTVITTVYGWYRGKPTWIFSWLGYSMVPVLAVGLALLYLPKLWSLILIPVYIPLSLWWLGYIVVQTTRRDWIFSSLMLMPIPIILGWVLAVLPELELTEYSLSRVHTFAPWIGLSFMALGLTIGSFIRLRQRWLRIGLLVMSGILTLTLVVYYTNGSLNTPTFLGLILVMWGIFLIPPLLEHFLRKGHPRLLKHGVS